VASLVLGVSAFLLLALTVGSLEVTTRQGSTEIPKVRSIPAWTSPIGDRPLVVYVVSSESQAAVLEAQVAVTGEDFTLIISPQEALYNDAMAEMTAIGTAFSVVDLRGQ